MQFEKTTSSKRIYSGRSVGLRVDSVEKPDGSAATREVVEHSPCVAVVVVDGHGQALLERQFRYPVGRSLLEVPAGGIDTGEQPVDAVRRELQEEIGYAPQTIQHLGGFYSVPGYGTEYLYCYLATDLVASRLVAEDTDAIELVPVPLEQVPQLIASGDICDAKSIAALLMYLTDRKDSS